MIDRTKIREIFDGSFVRQRLFGKSAETRRQYLFAFSRFDLFLGRAAVLDDLDDDVVAVFLMAHAESHSARATNNIRAYLLSFWRWCNAKGYVALGPTIGKLPEPESVPLAFTKEQLKLLFAQAQNEGRNRIRASRLICGVPAGLWWESLYRSIFSTGERIGAVRRWLRPMLDLETGVISEPGGIRKGGRFAHVVRLTETSLGYVRLVLDSHSEEEVFPWPRHPLAMYAVMERHLKRAGLPSSRHWKFHAIRKSHASYVALEAGEAAAQASLGHVSAANTKRYIAPAIVKPRTWENVLPEI